MYGNNVLSEAVSGGLSAMIAKDALTQIQDSKLLLKCIIVLCLLVIISLVYDVIAEYPWTMQCFVGHPCPKYYERGTMALKIQ